MGRGRPLRYLVTGAAGLLGRELTAALDESHREVLAVDRRSCDIADRDSVLGMLTTWRPDVVVHAAAWTAVDDCESDHDRAWSTNALGTRWIADGARRIGAHVVYLSTDYVFDGEKGAPYVEWDEPRPLSVYGRSKLGGERELDPGSTVVRTSWLFGRHGPSMVKTVLRLAAETEGPLRFVDDQVGSPSSAADVAAVVCGLAVGRVPGTFHVTNQGATSWYELARAILTAAGADDDRVEPIATTDLDPPRAAPRPACSVLDNAGLRLAGMALPPHHREPLERLVKELIS